MKKSNTEEERHFNNLIFLILLAFLASAVTVAISYHKHLDVKVQEVEITKRLNIEKNSSQKRKIWERDMNPESK